LSRLARQREARAPERVDGGAAALVTFTTGSTGAPKELAGRDGEIGADPTTCP